MVSPSIGLPQVIRSAFSLIHIYTLFLYLNVIIIINISKSHDLIYVLNIKRQFLIHIHTTCRYRRYVMSKAISFY